MDRSGRVAERISRHATREFNGIVDDVAEKVGHEPGRGHACGKSVDNEPAESFDRRIPLRIGGRGSVGKNCGLIHAPLDPRAVLRFEWRRVETFLSWVAKQALQIAVGTDGSLAQ